MATPDRYDYSNLGSAKRTPTGIEHVYYSYCAAAPYADGDACPDSDSDACAYSDACPDANPYAW